MVAADTPETPALFVVTLTGREAPAAPQLTVLAFAQGADEAAACARAVEALEALGWTGVEALRGGEVVRPDAVPDDFAAAMAAARDHGCGLIIYDED